MRVSAKEFADDPCSSVKRANMVRAARALLSAVTRLLCVADMADVYRLLASLKLVGQPFNPFTTRAAKSGQPEMPCFPKSTDQMWPN